MNPHLKSAYEHGVRTALQEVGITKVALSDSEVGGILGATGAAGLELAANRAVNSERITRLLEENSVITPKQTENLLEQTGFDKSLKRTHLLDGDLYQLLSGIGDGPDRLLTSALDDRLPASFTLRGAEPAKGHINLNRAMKEAGPATFAHELGHATQLQPGLLNRLRRANTRSLYSNARGLGMAASFVPLVTSPNSENPYLAPAVAGVGSQLPLLLEEGAASIKGYNALKRTGDYAPSALRAARNNLLAAGLTYLLPGAAIAATPLAIRYGQRNWGDD